MSSLFGLNKPNTNLNKNVFDLSEKQLFSTSAGLLTPCFVKEMNPGEKVQISLDSLVRTKPLNTAAFARVRQYYHFFFVPFKQLWSGWDNFINGVNYKTSAFQNNRNYDVVPRLDLFGAIASLLDAGKLHGLYNRSTKKLTIDAWKNYMDAELEKLKPKSTTPSTSASTDTIDLANLNSYSPAEQERMLFRYNRYKEQQLKIHDSALNAYLELQKKKGDIASNEALRNSLDEHGYPYINGISRLLDMLGYGFQFVDKDGNERSSTLSEIFDYILKDPTAKELNVLDWLKAQSMKNVVNPLRLLAYQKIYNDFYKRDDYEITNPLAFNVDDCGQDILMSDSNRILEIMRLRYRWQPKDYFTGVVPSELMPNELASQLMSSTGVSSTIPQTSIRVKDDNDVYSSSTLSAKLIRAVFAIEKQLRLTRRAGGFDYISQTSAHYGFTPPEGRGDKVDFIGGTSENVTISEVMATADTDGAGIGQIFGKGLGSAGMHELEYTAKEHGLIMCITSFVPDSDYNAVGMDLFNQKTRRGDYFHPELQDLGLQPINSAELANYIHDNRLPDNKKKNVVTLGYAPRYVEYKSSYDKLHGEFRAGKNMAQWSSSSNLRVVNTGLAVSTLKINPGQLDRIFAKKFDGHESNDQFMVNSQFICKMIRPMSVTGQNL